MIRFPRLNFSKLWSNPSDFPTIETSEAQVRADLQLLHDEAKNALNAFMDQLEASITETLINDANKIPTAKAVIDAMSSSGNGDMMKQNYDTTNTGNKVDTAMNAEKLGGSLASAFAKLASPTFTGTPKAPTPATTDNSTRLATTAFVKSFADSTNAKFQLVSYQGTGTYGAANPNSLTFTFAPDLLVWVGAETTKVNNPAFVSAILAGTSNSYSELIYVVTKVLGTDYKKYYGPGPATSVGMTTRYSKISADGRTISWYNTESPDSSSHTGAYQFNDSDSEYYVLAIKF